MPLSLAEAPAALLADQLDDQPLALEHGAPWRLVLRALQHHQQDYLALDGQYVRVLAVADLPPFVAAGWLSGVLAEKLALDVSLHVRPLDAGAAAGALKLKSWRLGGALNDDRANGRPEDNT